MFFLLRCAFWIGLVLVLLPRDPKPDVDSHAPHVGAADAVSAAGSVINDMSQFCTRQPAACEVGSQAAKELGSRAQDGAKKVYKIITDKKSDTTGSIGDPSTEAMAGSGVDTLTDDDRRLEWSLAVPPATTGAN
jgi:hypothetical protein